MEENRLSESRMRVAREAAILLYTSQEKEYKQAKKKATQTLGARVLPSNLEVAEEVDKIADETEGLSRQKRLLQMRKDALQLMEVLDKFHTRLIGSVWRGTVHRNSDIDIEAFTSSPEAVLAQMQKSNFKIEGTEWRSDAKRGKAEPSFHIYLTLPSCNEAEIVVRSPEEKDRLRKCEIYGDFITGLSYPQLRRVLKESPFQRFVPKVKHFKK
jgi:predicted nucleotidyltransferase